MTIAVILLGILAVALGLACVFLAKKNSALRKQSADTVVDNVRLQERLAFIEKEQPRMQKDAEDRFRYLAGEICSTEVRRFRQESELRLDEILRPLKENIGEFRRSVAESYLSESKERQILNEHLKQLIALNASIGKEARELADALKGNTKVQGDWGEMVLESILEKSGLVRGENYFVQETRDESGELLRNKEGRMLRPDVVVSLPDKKYVVIDSKVSLTAYVDFINAETEEARDRAGKAHVASVRAHLRELDMKKYQDYVGISSESRIDFVLMFIPNEHAYVAAMSLDKSLWQEAYDKRVVIISPAHVISTLRLIAQLWSRDKQTKNALRIAEEGGRLYDKFAGFVEDMKNIGTGIARTQAAYEGAFKKLSSGSGNLIARVQNLQALGAKAAKQLPENER